MKRQQIVSNAKRSAQQPAGPRKRLEHVPTVVVTSLLDYQYVAESVLAYCVCDKPSLLILTQVSRLWHEILTGRKATCALLDAQIAYALWPEWRLHAFHAPVNNVRGVASMSSRLCRNIRAHRQFLVRANTCLLKLELESKVTQPRVNRASSWYAMCSSGIISVAGTFFSKQFVVLPLLCRDCWQARRMDTRDWLIVCLGPPDSRYAGGLFVFHVTMALDIWRPPVVRLLTDVPHPNVRVPTLYVDIDMFKQDWSPAMRSGQLLATMLQSLLDSPVLDKCIDIPLESATSILAQVVSNAHVNQTVIPACPCISSSTSSGIDRHTPATYLDELASLIVF